MKLNLNDSEIMEIMNLVANALNEDALYDMEKATVRSVLNKINGQIQYQHHNAIDDSVCTILSDYYDLEGNEEVENRNLIEVEVSKGCEGSGNCCDCTVIDCYYNETFKEIDETNKIMRGD